MSATLYKRLTETEGGSKSLIGIEWNTNPDGPEAAALLRQISIHLRAAARHHKRGEYDYASIGIKNAAALLKVAGVPELEPET